MSAWAVFFLFGGMSFIASAVYGVCRQLGRIADALESERASREKQASIGKGKYKDPSRLSGYGA